MYLNRYDKVKKLIISVRNQIKIHKPETITVVIN